MDTMSERCLRDTQVAVLEDAGSGEKGQLGGQGALLSYTWPTMGAHSAHVV